MPLRRSSPAAASAASSGSSPAGAAVARPSVSRTTNGRSPSRSRRGAPPRAARSGCPRRAASVPPSPARRAARWPPRCCPSGASPPARRRPGTPPAPRGPAAGRRRAGAPAPRRAAAASRSVAPIEPDVSTASTTRFPTWRWRRRVAQVLPLDRKRCPRAAAAGERRGDGGDRREGAPGAASVEGDRTDHPAPTQEGARARTTAPVRTLRRGAARLRVEQAARQPGRLGGRRRRDRRLGQAARVGPGSGGNAIGAGAAVGRPVSGCTVFRRVRRAEGLVQGGGHLLSVLRGAVPGRPPPVRQGQRGHVPHLVVARQRAAPPAGQGGRCPADHDVGAQALGAGGGAQRGDPLLQARRRAAPAGSSASRAAQGPPPRRSTAGERRRDRRRTPAAAAPPRRARPGRSGATTVDRQAEAVEELGAQLALLGVHRTDQHEAARVHVRDTRRARPG